MISRRIAGSWIAAVLLTTILSLFLTGCAPPSQPTPVVPTVTSTGVIPEPSATAQSRSKPTGDCDIKQDWSATFRISGGFVGLDRRMLLSSDGSARLLDVSSNAERATQLEEDLFKRLSDTITAICPTPIPRSLETCADCFQYTLELTTPDGLAYSIRFSDDARLDPELESLIQQLRQITDEMLR